MNSSLLSLNSIKKYFPIQKGFFRKTIGWIRAVDNISLNLQQRETYAIVGESGSGKSTLGRAAIRLTDLTEGSVFFKNQSLTHLSSSQLKPYRRFMQMIFQDPYSSLNPRLTIEDALGEGVIYHRLVDSQKDKKDLIAHILNKIGLSSEAMARYPHQFSGGQQQRICIGRALILKPEVIVCDEVISALDVSIQAQILNLLSELKKEYHLSYLFISHDLNTVQFFADKVIVMYLGKEMESGTTEEIFTSPKHPYTRILLKSIPTFYPHQKKERVVLKGEIPSAANPPSGCPFRTRCPYAKPECAITIPLKQETSTHRYFCILD